MLDGFQIILFPPLSSLLGFLYPSFWLQFREALKQVLNFKNVLKFSFFFFFLLSGNAG